MCAEKLMVPNRWSINVEEKKKKKQKPKAIRKQFLPAMTQWLTHLTGYMIDTH